MLRYAFRASVPGDPEDRREKHGFRIGVAAENVVRADIIDPAFRRFPVQVVDLARGFVQYKLSAAVRRFISSHKLCSFQSR